MKYVRNIEDLKKYTFEFFDSFLPQDLSDKMANYFLLGIGDKDYLESACAEKLQKANIPLNTVCEYGEVILQLNDYKDILKKFVTLLLKANTYEHLCAFLSRIFLQQIGDVKYKSFRQDYSINERYFDRFIEIIIFCKLEKDLYMPFFTSILGSDSSSKMIEFKRPLKEYLDNFLKQNEDEKFISDLLNSNNNKGVQEYASQNTLKTLNALIDGFVANEITNTALLKKAFSGHKMETFNIIEKMLNDADAEINYKAVLLLNILKEDKRALERLVYVYDTTKDAKIKNFLAKELQYNSFKKFSSKQEFEDYVAKNIAQIQERLYGARLNRFYKEQGLNNAGIEGKILTFVMETFKERVEDFELNNYKEFFCFVSGEVLQKLAQVVYDVATHRHKLENSKWALRLIAVFGSSELIYNMQDDISTWFEKTSTEKVARYFLDILSFVGRQEFIEVCKTLLSMDLTKKQKAFLTNKTKVLSKTSNQSVESVNDKLTYDFGFNKNGEKTFKVPNRVLVAKIQDDCTINLYNQKTGKPARVGEDIYYDSLELREYLKMVEKEIKKQKKRLFGAFLEFRKYTPQTFEDCIISNNLLNFLAQNCAWARYKNGKLAEVLALKDDKLEHVIGNVITEDVEEYDIALLQPVDCVAYKTKLKEKFGTTLFDQFDFPVFDINDFAPNSNYVESFNGMFCTAKLFITRLEKLKYRINDLNDRAEYSTLVKVNENLNLLTTVEFDKVVLNHEDNSTTISKVRFYTLNKLTRIGKRFLIDKKESKTLSEMDPHVFSNELAQIYLACKN